MFYPSWGVIAMREMPTMGGGEFPMRREGKIAGERYSNG